MKAPVLFVIVFMIHVMGICGFVLMQGCATRQPLEGTSQSRAVTPPSASSTAVRTPAPAIRTSSPVMPPRPGTSSTPVKRPQIKEYVPPKPRMTTPPPAPTAAVASSAEAETYKVAKGDSLSKIAKRYGISSRELAAFNGINDPNKIRIGQKLYIPGNAKKTIRSTTTPRVNTSVKPKPRSGDGYVVRAGDSLSKIAVAHGTSVKALKQANNLSGDRILVGQVLALPGGKVAKAAKPTPKASKPVAQKPRMETISITPVTPKRTVVQETPEPKKPVAAVVEKPVKKQVATPEPVIDQSFEYTVQEGETLRDIANAFIVSSEDILKINNLSSENAIRPGMKLKIPPSEF